MGFPREKRRSCYLLLIWWHFTFSPTIQNKSRLGSASRWAQGRRA